MSEDAPVTYDGDDKRQQHADDDKEDGVVVGGTNVPQALLSLGIEATRRPAKMVRRVEGNTREPSRNQSDDSATSSEQSIIGVVPADVQVTIESDDCDGEQRHDTADDAEAGCSCTQPLSSVQEPLLSHHRTFNYTYLINVLSNVYL